MPSADGSVEDVYRVVRQAIRRKVRQPATAYRIRWNSRITKFFAQCKTVPRTPSATPDQKLLVIALDVENRILLQKYRDLTPLEDGEYLETSHFLYIGDDGRAYKAYADFQGLHREIVKTFG